MWGVEVQPASESAEKLHLQLFVLPTIVCTRAQKKLYKLVQDTQTKHTNRGGFNEMSQTQPRQHKMHDGRKNRTRRDN